MTDVLFSTNAEIMQGTQTLRGLDRLTSWLEGFSLQSPELEVTLCLGKLAWAQSEHLPISLLSFLGGGAGYLETR